MPCLDVAGLTYAHNFGDKFLRSLSFVIHLELHLIKSVVACCNTIKFSRLIEFYFSPDNLVVWLEPFMFFLQNSPKLKLLTINTVSGRCLPPSWNQPSSDPECLSSHLEIFRWRGYGGRGDERQLVTYILANSKCLKTVEISLLATCNLEETQKELESMPRISQSSQLLISTKMLWSSSSNIQLKSLTIHTKTGGLPPSWNQPSAIHECLSSHLEIFGWRGYGGREDEKHLMTYILANSKCLKTVEISLLATCNLKDSQKELESMPRISTTSIGLFPLK
ncbi:unnamed protein product [Arabidopsis halleri]